MKLLNSIAEIAPVMKAPRLRAIEVITSRLTDADEAEVLNFLAQRPIHTVAMVGFIQDNGIVSPLNRGAFYGCRNKEGQLEGVALIGHATLLETITDRALEALAEIAQTCNVHMIMGETDLVDSFWCYYGKAGQKLRQASREWLFELKWPIEALPAVPGLQLATSAELDLIIPLQAELAFAESGVNPLERDPEGFRRRCARRIEQGRTWIWVEASELVFKADVVSDTSSVIYLEGVWTNPNHRSQGRGLRCLSQLGRSFLCRAKSVCVLVNENNELAHKFYQRAGYKLRGVYDTIFLN
jgi:GNAT superfamily N-acetyltransferase